jgi:hypothetical protein
MAISMGIASEIASARFMVFSLNIAIVLASVHPGGAAKKTVSLCEVVALEFAGMGG